MTQNKFGKLSTLHLTFTKSDERTILSHVKFTAPFKVMKPFYDENDELSVMIMNSSAGIMAGDQQEIKMIVEEQAKAKVYSQSYEKIHKMVEGFGERNCEIQVESGGILQYSPLPTIPFADSSFCGRTKINLKDSSSKLIFSEMFSCGRVAMGESFLFRSYGTELLVYCENRLIFRDKLLFSPQEQNLSGFLFQEGYSHQSTLLLFHFTLPKEKEEELIAYVNSLENVEAGVSKTYTGGFFFRFLGNSGEQLEKIHEKVLDFF